jgi:transcriptional regulator with XRE-family HTH domain
LPLYIQADILSNMNVPMVLRDARSRAGLSQTALAGLTDTSQATISAYESGRKSPSIETLSRLLAATGARLTVEPEAPRVVEPSAAQHARVGRTLVDVIALAEALPARHERHLRFPRLDSPARRAA